MTQHHQFPQTLDTEGYILNPCHPDQIAPEFRPLIRALCEQLQARFASIEQIRKGLREHSECRVLLCDPKIRRQLHHYLHRQFPDVQILAYQEIAEDYRVKQVHLFQQEIA